MLGPTDLLPSSLGLAWGLSRDQCLDQLAAPIVGTGSEEVIVRLPIGDATYDLALRFAGFRPEAGLERLTVYLYESRDFWEPGEDLEDDLAEREAIATDYERRYEDLVAQYTSLLGPPAYSATWTWDDEDYPEGEPEGDLTYWTTPEGRLQLVCAQPDQELPFVIRLDCYATGPTTADAGTPEGGAANGTQR